MAEIDSQSFRLIIMLMLIKKVMHFLLKIFLPVSPPLPRKPRNRCVETTEFANGVLLGSNLGGVGSMLVVTVFNETLSGLSRYSGIFRLGVK